MDRMKCMLLLWSLNSRAEEETIIGIFKYAQYFLCTHVVCMWGGIVFMRSLEANLQCHAQNIAYLQ